jgi:hypothetical protein
VDLPRLGHHLLGRRERVRRGGFPSQAAARRARDEWLATTGQERTARSWTVERWLRYRRPPLPPSAPPPGCTTAGTWSGSSSRTWAGYAYLDARWLRAMFAEIA